MEEKHPEFKNGENHNHKNWPKGAFEAKLCCRGAP